MKKKLLCVTVILAACLIAIIANWHVDNTRENTKTRVHQHLEAESAEELPACSHKSSRICTHLPLVSIDTRGRQLSEKRESKIFCDIRIWDEEGKRHHLTDTPDIETASQINIRGASSRHFDKHSYRLEFRENKNPAEKKNLSIMGMEDVYKRQNPHFPFPLSPQWSRLAPFHSFIPKNVRAFAAAGKVPGGGTLMARFLRKKGHQERLLEEIQKTEKPLKPRKFNSSNGFIWHPRDDSNIRRTV